MNWGHIATGLAAWAVVGLAACDGDKTPPPAQAAQAAATPAKADGSSADASSTGGAAPAPTPAQQDTGEQGPSGPDLTDDPALTPKAEAASGSPIDPLPKGSSTLLTVEAKSPAIKRGKLVQNVGFGLPGGRMAPVLTTGCEAPCWSPAPMWASAEAGTSLEFTLYRHKHAKLEGATALGKYTVSSIPPAKAGKHTEVVLGLGAVDGALVMHATLREGGAPVPIAATP